MRPTKWRNIYLSLSNRTCVGLRHKAQAIFLPNISSEIFVFLSALSNVALIPVVVALALQPSEVYFPNVPHRYLCYIKSAIAFVMWYGKTKKSFSRDVKEIYNTPTKEVDSSVLKNFEQKWANKYAYAVRSWQQNWDELTTFFDFPLDIRQILYTTNMIENLNGKIRKYTKNKLSFPNDGALLKFAYLALREASKK